MLTIKTKNLNYIICLFLLLPLSRLTASTWTRNSRDNAADDIAACAAVYADAAATGGTAEHDDVRNAAGADADAGTAASAAAAAS